MTPRRRLAPNDARAESVVKPQRRIVDYGIGSSITLPPSTAGTTSIDITRIETGSMQ